MMDTVVNFQNHMGKGNWPLLSFQNKTIYYSFDRNILHGEGIIEI